MLSAELDFTSCKHLPDRQLIRAALFTCAAANAVPRLLAHRGIALSGPVAQAIAIQIALQHENAADGNTRRAGLAIVAAAAELRAQLLTDGVEFGARRTCPESRRKRFHSVG